MTRDDWEKLAQRCRDAEGPDRGIDCAIALALGYTHDGYPEPYRKWTRVDADGHRWSGSQIVMVNPWSSSIDALRGLIERELPGWFWGTSPVLGPWGSLTELKDCDTDPFIYAKTPALGLCAAFCYAMATNV
jgi:hypothetical protein